MSGEPTYAIIDIETTRDGTFTDHDGSPFDPANYIVLEGYKRGDSKATCQWEPDYKLVPSSLKFGDTAHGGTGIKLIVGQNIAHDIHFKRKAGTIDEGFLGTVNLWDTQLAEYLINAQRSVMVSLDELSAKYGGTAKDVRVTKMFEAGMGADKVPMPMLKNYHAADLLNTELVFVKQFEIANEMGLIPLITTQMDALAATIEMTYNGLAVDRDELMLGAEQVGAEVKTLEAILMDVAAHYGGYFKDFNPGSTKQLSLLLFGGEVKTKVKEAVGTFKNGNTRHALVEKIIPIYGMKLTPTGPKNGKGDYPTDDKALQELLIALGAGRTIMRRFIETMVEWREKNKQLGTYWEGLLKLVYPDGCIHHRLNHTVTRTGRLSSSDPNLQNVTNGEIKRVFVSRWGDDGVIVEADFKQLEMVELAILSADTQLLHDILNGVDMHDALFEKMHGRKMRKDERKGFKRCSFALVYGAGAGGVAAQGGISKNDAKKFIETFYDRYKGVKEYHDYLIQWAKDARKYTGLKSEEGLPVGEATWTALATGRRYWFREYKTDWGTIGFSPTELKNYMVQGGATGDKVPLCIGKLYRVLRNHPTLKDKCLLINTVHDSVMFDCKKEVLQEALSLIKEVMERTPEFYEEAFGYKMPLPLKVELSYGPNWLDQQEVHYQDFEWKVAA